MSRFLRVQYPAVYRILQSLQGKGWIEVSQERPNRSRARAPRIVAEEARESKADDLTSAAEVAGNLGEAVGLRSQDPMDDLWIYKGTEGVGPKLREVVLASEREVLCASPFPIGRPVLQMVADAPARSRRLARLVLSEANREDLAELGGVLSPHLRVRFRFPTRSLPRTRLAHPFVFPNDRELFILNSFYRNGVLVPDRNQGLWVGDADFVRVQLEAMLEDLEATKKRRRGLPRRA